MSVYLLDEVQRYVNQKFCGFKAEIKKYVIDSIAGIPSGGGSDPTADTGAPAMTKSALAASTGTTGNSVYLTDGISPAMYAWKDVHDTTTVAGPTVIVDADGTRWKILSIRDLLDNYLNNYSPFP